MAGGKAGTYRATTGLLSYRPARSERGTTNYLVAYRVFSLPSVLACAAKGCRNTTVRCTGGVRMGARAVMQESNSFVFVHLCSLNRPTSWTAVCRHPRPGRRERCRQEQRKATVLIVVKAYF